MASFKEESFVVNITKDESGVVRSAIMRQGKDGQWEWWADVEFGPFDTYVDVVKWLVKSLSRGSIQLT